MPKHKLYDPFREIFLIKDKNNNFGLEITLTAKYIHSSSHLVTDTIVIYGKLIDGKWKLGLDDSESKDRVLKEYGIDAFNKLKAIFGDFVKRELKNQKR